MDFCGGVNEVVGKGKMRSRREILRPVGDAGIPDTSGVVW